MTAKRPKIALVISHPVQHFCPQYASFAKSGYWQFKVFFMSALGYKAYEDKNFGRQIVWDNLRLDEFDHHFMNPEAVAVSKKTNANKLLPEIEKYDPDVVISYGYAQLFQRQVKTWARSVSKRLYYISDSELHHRENTIKRYLKSFVVKRYFKGIDRFLTVGTANEAYYRRNGVPPSKITRMNFPIDVEYYNEIYQVRQQERTKIRARYQLGENDFVCCVVGKLVSWKNQEDIVKALSILDPLKGKKITLFIIGTGEEEEKLKTMATQLKHHHVHLTGFVKPTDLASYYTASDLYVHPAAYEPHSLAISEAIYMGLPLLISSSCGSYGPDDDLIIGQNGHVYETGNIHELADKLKLLQESPGTIKKFGAQSRKYAITSQQLAHRLGLENALRTDGLIN